VQSDSNQICGIERVKKERMKKERMKKGRNEEGEK
jgi:hypothetical protein